MVRRGGTAAHKAGTGETNTAGRAEKAATAALRLKQLEERIGRRLERVPVPALRQTAGTKGTTQTTQIRGEGRVTRTVEAGIRTGSRGGGTQSKESRGRLTTEAQSLAKVPVAPRAHGLFTARKAHNINIRRSDRAGVVGRDTQPKNKERQEGHRHLSQWLTRGRVPSGIKPGPDRPTGGIAGGKAAGKEQGTGKEGGVPASAGSTGRKAGHREEERRS